MAGNACGGLVDEGVRLFESGDFSGALDKFSRAVELCPDNVGATLWKGKAELMAGRLDEALATLRGVLKVSEDPLVVVDASFSLALGLFIYSFFSTDRRGRLQEASDYLSRAVMALRRAGDRGRPVEDLSKRMGADPDKLVRFLGGLIRAELGDPNVKVDSEKGDLFQKIVGIYLDVKYENWDCVLDRIYEALFLTETSPGLDKPVRGLLRDFLYILLARVFGHNYLALDESSAVQGVNPLPLTFDFWEEAMFAVRMASGHNVMRALAYLYAAKMYEAVRDVGQACAYYSRILELFNAPVAREKVALLGCSPGSRAGKGMREFGSRPHGSSTSLSDELGKLRYGGRGDSGGR